MRLLQNLLHLPFYLGAAPLGSKDTEVFVCVQNNGKLPLDWRIRDPSDFDVRAEHWVEERDLRKGMMHQMGGMGLGGNGGGGASGGEGGRNDDNNNGGDGSGGKPGKVKGVRMSAISIEPREGHL
ncbi:uncharacterized protein MONOS_6439 [Monocercomonoides exilis]|uniref:uncharacterized protein n=1 Tax=Monocercomonoides exilis TaxID=2049356 RepID=UPI003559B722|nr:hypothetical protein MONOS_6439 [Monocercomonoides exilis]|eukprot:MONOS_6439.1-p1 / transcript=MONOS_6439.1 / gene=MONOS_6439 / organism=Monocercomonoides_exilis_PA203 / gene_product=unspecified product / transcript_product=unspecified product / location=Mono_scaffold00202:74724-75098(-) / protein_length=125 / sequence_SO=supercontig / SO=protein_coding / is_pseudo=false